jgi:hypothetical protein
MKEFEPQNIEQGISNVEVWFLKLYNSKQNLHHSTFLVGYSIFVF